MPVGSLWPRGVLLQRLSVPRPPAGPEQPCPAAARSPPAGTRGCRGRPGSPPRSWGLVLSTGSGQSGMLLLSQAFQNSCWQAEPVLPGPFGHGERLNAPVPLGLEGLHLSALCPEQARGSLPPRVPTRSGERLVVDGA